MWCEDWIEEGYEISDKMYLIFLCSDDDAADFWDPGSLVD